MTCIIGFSNRSQVPKDVAFQGFPLFTVAPRITKRSTLPTRPANLVTLEA